MNIMQVKEKQNNNPLDLWEFSSRLDYIMDWQPLPHINLIYEFLHYAMNGQLENFMCALSPRLGKSMAVSEVFPAYILGRRPYAKIIHVSYNEKLASGFGDRAKDTFDNYGYLFKDTPKLSKNSKSKTWFRVEGNSGEYFCSGFEGSILGRGGNWLIVDDPIKTITEARSDTYQQRLIDLFDTAISTRKEKDPVTGQKAVTIIIHQRLDPNDLIGIILQTREWISAEEALPRLRRGESLGNVWVYLRLPELAEENDILGREVGEPLWPEKRDEAELLQIQEDIGTYHFDAIYQQNPRERAGKYFNTEYFERIFEQPNNILEEIQWTDLAGTYYDPSIPLHKRGASTASA